MRQVAVIRCLRIQEVLEVVMDDLRESSRKDVARMARTCKTFYHVAVAVLWRDVTGLRPFMSTIPGYTWVKGYEWIWEPTRSNDTDFDVRRLAFYVSYIKSFTWKFDGDITLYSAARFLQGIPRLMVLLPACRTAKFEDDKDWFNLLVNSRLFVAPVLEELYSNACARHAEPIFQRLHQIFPRLKTLHMTGPSSSVTWPPPPLTGHTLAPLTTTRISTFDAHDPLTINALRVLSAMQTLEHVRARLELRSDSNLVAAQPGRPFCSLKSLRLFARMINNLTLTLIKSISSTELQCLELTVKARAQSHLSEQFLLAHMTALSRAPFRNSLREFKLYLHHDEQVDLQWNIGSQILRPVLGRLDSLVSLQIFGDAIALDFEMCRNVAEAFPRLETLALMDEGNDLYAGSLSPRLDTAARAAPLEGLAFFAKHCRALTSIRMPVRIESSVLPAWPAAQDVSATIQDGLILLRLEGDEEAVVYDSVRAYVDVLLPAYEGLFMY